MNCRERQHDIVLFLYEELSSDASQDLRSHMETCAICEDFYESEKRLHIELSEDFSDWEIPAGLLLDCRRELSDELDRIDQKRDWWQLPTPGLGFPRMRLLESAALLSIGLALGVYVTNRLDPPASVLPPQDSIATLGLNSSVANLRIVESDPDSGQIALAGEVVQPMRVEGSIEDENVRQLLFGALRSASNPGFRLQAVELLSQNPRDPNVKETLLQRLLNDDNPGVRLYALQALQSFSGEEDVREALKFVVETDEVPGIRVQALEALAPMTPEEAMSAAIEEAVREDPNEYIRMRELQFVGGN